MKHLSVLNYCICQVCSRSATVSSRHGVIVIFNSDCNRKLPDFAVIVIVIDCIFPKVIVIVIVSKVIDNSLLHFYNLLQHMVMLVIDPQVIDTSLLHFYNLLQHMVMLLPKSWLFVSCKYNMVQTTEHCSNNTSPERGCWDNSVGPTHHQSGAVGTTVLAQHITRAGLLGQQCWPILVESMGICGVCLADH